MTKSLKKPEIVRDFPGGSEVKASARSVGDQDLIPVLGRFPWRRKWHPTPVFLPGESHGRRNLVGYSPWGCKNGTLATKLPPPSPHSHHAVHKVSRTYSFYN